MRNREIVWLSDDEKAFVQSFLLEEDDDILVFNKPAGLPCQTRKVDDQTLDKLQSTTSKLDEKTVQFNVRHSSYSIIRHSAFTLF